MNKLLEGYLMEFRPCFSRSRTFKYFVLLVIGFMQRSDFLGVTSVVRDLLLNPNSYDSIIHFFRSTGWSLVSIRQKWYSVVLKYGDIFRISDRVVLVGDGVKVSKEARYMPGVKKLRQESEDSSKAEYIFGHMLGAVGVLLGEGAKLCLPLKINIQDGIQAAADWENSTISKKSHVVQMIENGFEIAKTLGKSLIVLDRLFLTAPALERLAQLNSEFGDDLLQIVTKAKSNCMAFKKPEAQTEKHRGRPRKKGEAVKLNSLWNEKDKFIDGKARMYGEVSDVSYYAINLLWGKKIYQELQFVLVSWKGCRSILVSSNLSMTPVQIIEAYAARFKIEHMFRAMNQSFGGFFYHFWTKSLSKLNRYKKKGEKDALQKVANAHDKKLILNKIREIEMFIQISCIAMGFVQMISLNQELNIDFQKFRYIRTQPRNRISEETIMTYMRKVLFVHLLQNPESFITRFIQETQKEQSDSKTS